MKKLMILVLALISVLGLIGCSADKGSAPNDAVTDNTYMVVNVTESSLLVAEIDENGKAIDAKQYHVPNWFYPNTEIEKGNPITIDHNGIILETFPMQFAEIYSMEYYDKETDLSTVVTAD